MNYDAISPVDGRYRNESEPLASYFSERALIDQRVKVELAYLRFLMRLRIAPRIKVPRVSIAVDDVKKLEFNLGHDVKAVEVSLRQSLARLGGERLASYVHLGLTSEDTNSLAFALLLRSALKDVVVPAYSSLASQLARLAGKEAKTPMVARTHGRPAVPTTFGKEMAVFAVRIAERVSKLGALKPVAKFSGAVGTYASFSVLGNRDWPEELAKFVDSFGVDHATYSTQVAPGERLSDILHCIINLNQLVLSLSRDLWFYQTLDLVRFLRPGKVSSSTMPQKVNPVDLENAEGQVEISNALLMLLAYRLQVTRMQRDLSDSVIRRMVGQALAHALVANSRLRASLSSMRVDRSSMAQDLRRHPEIYAEREQVVMRLRGDARGYEKVREAIVMGKFTPRLAKGDLYLGRAISLAKGSSSVVRRLLRSSS